MSLARRISRAQPKRAAPCIFCDQPRGSKEHFWPEWMHPLLPTLPDPRYDRKVIDTHPVTGEQRSGRLGAQGGVETIKIRAVCTDCNNGWMNQLEAAARPALTPLIAGQAVSLEGAQVRDIARWIAMKCMVSEHGAPNRALTPRSDREAMRQSLTIPSYYRIYLAAYATQSIAYRRNSHLISLTPEMRPPLAFETTKNIQTITFFMGHAFVHVNAARIDDFDLESRVQLPGFYPEARIFPPRGVNAFRRPLDRQGVSLVAHTLQLYLDACDIHWDEGLGD